MELYIVPKKRQTNAQKWKQSKKNDRFLDGVSSRHASSELAQKNSLFKFLPS